MFFFINLRKTEIMVNIAINNDVYDWASIYASEHHTSIRNLVESYLKKLRPSIVKADEAEEKLQELVSLTKGLKLSADDLNGDKAKQEYLEEKYAR